jgi:hypothetical protein
MVCFLAESDYAMKSGFEGWGDLDAPRSREASS